MEKKNCGVWGTPHTALFNLWPKISTFNRDQSTEIQKDAQTCGHTDAIVRNVCAPGAAAAYICRDCYQRLCAAEAHAAAVGRFRSLFRDYPPVNWLGGAVEALAGRIVNYLLARALLAAYRGNSHWLFVALARLVARILKGRGPA